MKIHRPSLPLLVSVWAVLLNLSDSELLIRSSQARIFPLDSDPPEETLELWMGRQSHPVAHLHHHSDDIADFGGDDKANDDLISGVDCAALGARQAGHGTYRYSILMAALDCLRCQHHLATGGNDDDCRALLCRNRKCKRHKENVRLDDQLKQVPSMSKRGDMWPQVGVNDNGDDITKESLYGDDDDENDFRPRLKPEVERTPTPSLDLRRGRWPGGARRRHLEKRYRLGLYDCITSYCGKLEGPDRQGCIVNACHRASTLKM